MAAPCVPRVKLSASSSSKSFKSSKSCKSSKVVLVLYMISLSCYPCHAWDPDDLQLFDLVEDVQENFYELLQLQQNAEASQIRKAYRRLSLQWHPDKNDADNATEVFRNIVSVYEVLKDEKKRKRYDEILEHGLPDWRQPVFYYRRVRKMSLLEICALLFFVFTVGHFIVIWSAYWEKRFTLSELMSSSRKRREKRNRKQKMAAASAQDGDVDQQFAEEIEELIQRPSLSDLLPVRTFRYTVYLCVSIPMVLRILSERLKKCRQEDVVTSSEEPADDCKRRRRPSDGHINLSPSCVETADVQAFVSMGASCATDPCDVDEAGGKVALPGGDLEWSEEQLVQLTRLVARFPGGTADRWTKISEILRRPQADVAAMAKKLKDRSFAVSVDPARQGITGMISSDTPAVQQVAAVEDVDNSVIRQRRKVVMQEDSGAGSGSGWSQAEQRKLELALVAFPKGSDERWERIAQAVDSKSKDDCLLRYKQIVEKLRQKKQSQKS